MRRFRVGVARVVAAGMVAASLLSVSPVMAQQPAPPAEDPGIWIGDAGAGLSLTSGNSDTLNFNLALRSHP